jgi:cysteine-rich repeat protein
MAKIDNLVCMLLLALGGCIAPPAVLPSMCGDGIVSESAGEECDDRGVSSTCNIDCTLALCGDGMVNAIAGEECDTAGSSASCDSDCTVARCGDGLINPTAGESCDDGNVVAGDGCADCRTNGICGNGTLDTGETCDDSNTVDGDGCSASCRLESCGNGTLEPGESCDHGGVFTATCDSDCTPAICGDGVLNPMLGEQCDDGGRSATCDHDCTLTTCGDGVVNTAVGEECDTGGDSVSCDHDCTVARCGDRMVNPLAGETCDEGGVDTTTCNRDCTVPVCGDGQVNRVAGEDCETGGESFFCDGDCTFAWCGDGVPNAAAGEACDDGNADDSDWCSPSCESASCDDGIHNGDEQGVDCGGLCGACGGIEAMVVAGAAHTCALLETGTVRCWGHSTHGALGYGNTSSIGDDEAPATAGDVDVGSAVVQLAASMEHTCALLETGAVRCWGYGLYGQLGYGNTSNIGDDEAPVTAGDVDVGGIVVQLAAGDYHTCALLETSAVRCWGDGTYGQLGYGNTNNIGEDETPATAGDVDVGGVVVQLAAGWMHTCALLETGAVRCWGHGGAGQLGYGNTSHIGDGEAPATAGDVDVGGVVVQLAAGEWHTCALLETGAVRCWGYGGAGQLGYGHTSNIGEDETPATAGDVPVGGVVVRLAVGAWHTCALLETGAVRCWGRGQEGQLGYGSTSHIGDDEAPATAGDVDVGGVVVQLAADGHHTCALLETGAVRCWGNGGGGRLGYGHTSAIGDDEHPASAGDVPYR